MLNVNYLYLLPIRSSKGSKKKGPRTPSPPPPVPLDIPVVGKKHKNKHKNKEKSEEKQKEGKDRGRDTEKHKEKKEKRRYLHCVSLVFSVRQMWQLAIIKSYLLMLHTYSLKIFSLYDFKHVFDCRDRSDSSNKAKWAVTSEEHSGSVSSPSRGATPPPRKKSSSPKASHKISVLPSPPNRCAHYTKFLFLPLTTKFF